MEGDGHAKAGEDEVGGVKQRVADPVARAERALYQKLRGADRILADQKHHEPGDEERHDHVDQRDQAVIDPGRQFGVRGGHRAVYSI